MCCDDRVCATVRVFVHACGGPAPTQAAAIDAPSVERLALNHRHRGEMEGGGGIMAVVSWLAGCD